MRTQTIYFNPITPIYENRAPGIMVVGSPGSGKTYFAISVFQNMLRQRARILVIDPKNDMQKIMNLAPKQVKNINLMDGYSLDPFVVIENIDTNFVLSLIETLIGKGQMTLDMKTSITPLITDFIRKSKTLGNVTFQKFVNYLYQHRDTNARNIGNLIKANEDSQCGNILFGKGTPLTIDGSSCVFTLMGLPFPKDDNCDNWTQEQRFGSAVIQILTKILSNVLERDNKVPSLLVCDEAHIVLGNPEIFKIIDNFLVLGRSLNCATMLISQNVDHFPEDFGNQISNAFIFRSSEENAVQFFNRFAVDNKEDTYQLTKIIAEMGSGCCLMIDRNHRMGFIKIDKLDISTNPFEK